LSATEELCQEDYRLKAQGDPYQELTSSQEYNSAVSTSSLSRVKCDQVSLAILKARTTIKNSLKLEGFTIPDQSKA